MHTAAGGVSVSVAPGFEPRAIDAADGADDWAVAVSAISAQALRSAQTQPQRLKLQESLAWRRRRRVPLRGGRQD